MATSDRRPDQRSEVLDQDFLDEAHDNLVNQLELIVLITAPNGDIVRGSDRNKYVGENFYRARLTFPVIRRTVGEFLSPNLEFSDLTLELNNVDQSLNQYLPEGQDFSSWINNKVEVRLGLRDVESTYTTIFEGHITEEGGLKRTVNSVIINARDDFDRLNISFPSSVLTKANFPNLEDDLENTILPVIYGDWTVNVEPNLASIPTTILNGADPTVNGDTSHTTNLQLVISENALSFFDTTQVYLRRGESAWVFDSADIVNVAVDNTSFEIKQLSLNMTALTPDTADEPFQFSSGDEILVKVRGKDLGAYDNNTVAIAKDILKTYAGMVDADFDANWDTFRDKASPTESAVANIGCRVWIQEPQEALLYALSLLEQVRLEAFIDRNLRLKINSLHFDDFVAPANIDFKIRKFDLERGSFQPELDERNNFNRCRGVYNFLPNRNENLNKTPFYRNSAAITGANNKVITKGLVFPNLYESTAVENQTIETLKLTSGYIEHLVFNATWRSLLLDIGDFVSIDVKIQGTQFNEVPAMIREIGYDPAGIKIPMKVWSFQMLPYPGHSPGFAGITGGSTATITEET